MYVHRRRTRLEIWTPAKLNLFLEVLGRRPDGYHEIETLMVPIGVFDTLRFCSRDDDRFVLSAAWASSNHSATPSVADDSSSGTGDLPLGADNLVIRALARLRERAGVSLGMTVELVKRIPSAAGLGGGSSDAAAALIAANELWGLAWTREQLVDVASEIGSDVPFFLYGRAAFCRGRGEIIQTIRIDGPLHFVVLRPPAGLSTADVYRATVVPEAPVGWSAGRSRAELPLFNRLQEAAERVGPWLHDVREGFQRLPVAGHQMSGSGSAYFGICLNAKQAQHVAATVRSRFSGRVFCTQMVMRDPQAFVRTSQN